MAQLDNSRVTFPKNTQRTFFDFIKKKLNLTDIGIARLLEISSRSFTDWKRGKNTIPLIAIKRLCKEVKVPLPKNLTIKEKFWYAKIGAPLGGKEVHRIYGSQIGNQEYRLKKLRNWWDTVGKNSDTIIGKMKPFTIPEKSPALSEFLGIMIGDGGMTQYQFRITLNKDTDKKYILYVTSLIWKLFKIRAKRLPKKNAKAVDIVVSRKGINDYLISLGLKSGNKLKQNLNIPSWIMANKKYSRMCLRGLIDTDGCVFKEIHHINSKKYSYNRLNFVTGSPLLAQSVFKILESESLCPKLRREGKAVQVENKEKIWQYFRTIGTSNPKHLARWRSL